MQTASDTSGKVLRVGPGWVDVAIGQRVVRVKAHPGLLLRPGNPVRIRGEYAVAAPPAHSEHSAAAPR